MSTLAKFVVREHQLCDLGTARGVYGIRQHSAIAIVESNTTHAQRHQVHTIPQQLYHCRYTLGSTLQ